MLQKLSQLIDAIGWPWLGCSAAAALLIWAGLRTSAKGSSIRNLLLVEWAALGTCLGILLREHDHAIPGWTCAIAMAAVAALIIALLDRSKNDLQTELVTGALLAAGAAFAFLALQRVKESDDELRTLLGGELMLARREQIWLIVGICAALGILCFALRRKFSAGTALCSALGLNMIVAAAAAIFLPIGGLLLTASLTVVPVLCGKLAARSFGAAWAIGWAIATIASAIGMTISFKMDLPSGAAVSGVMAAALLLCAPIAAFRKKL